MSTALAEVRTMRDLVPVLDVREGVWVAKEGGRAFLQGMGLWSWGGLLSCDPSWGGCHPI